MAGVPPLGGARGAAPDFGGLEEALRERGLTLGLTRRVGLLVRLLPLLLEGVAVHRGVLGKHEPEKVLLHARSGAAAAAARAPRSAHAGRVDRGRRRGLGGGGLIFPELPRVRRHHRRKPSHAVGRLEEALGGAEVVGPEEAPGDGHPLRHHAVHPVLQHPARRARLDRHEAGELPHEHLPCLACLACLLDGSRRPAAFHRRPLGV
mmetsp:Transcript_70407/g.159274  ORF Transcript_70407/g.159274 Transcript_70407/m.159274 type:complete len:206 (-) Transcript_70407:216-833(-)